MEEEQQTTTDANELLEAEENKDRAEAVGEAVKHDVKEFEERYRRAREQVDSAVSRLRDQAGRLHLDDSCTKVRSWIERNPTLAAAIAIGGGIVIGQLVRKSITPTPPPSVSERARMQAALLASQAGALAHDLGERGKAGAERAGKSIAKASHTASKEVRVRGQRAGKEAARISGDLAHRGAHLYDDLR